MVKNIFIKLPICSVICFTTCLFLIGTCIDEIRSTIGYADFFTNQNEYRLVKVQFDDVDTLAHYGGEYATSSNNELKGIMISLKDDWQKYIRYSKNEDGYDDAVQKNLTFPVWYNAKNQAAFCSYSIKTKFTDYLHYLFSKNHYFEWWCYIFTVFIVCFLVFILGSMVYKTEVISEIISILYWLFAITLVPFSFVALGLCFIIPFNAFNERVLNYSDYQPKQISIDSFNISASYSGSRNNSTFEGYYGKCYSNELYNIEIEVKHNRIINANGLGGFVKKKMLVWYNPKTKNAFLANNILPLKSYTDTLIFEFKKNRFLLYCLTVFLLMIILIYFHKKNKIKRAKVSLNDQYDNYEALLKKSR